MGVFSSFRGTAGPANSERPDHGKAQPVSLVSYLFVRVALPVGIVLVGSFALLDFLVQRQLRNYMTEALVAADRQTARTLEIDAARLGQSVAALADATGLADALPEQGALAHAQIATRLRRIAPLLAGDLYAIAGADRRGLLTLRRNGNELVEGGALSAPEKNGIANLADGAYYVFTFPIRKENRVVGWLTAGRHWVQQLTQGNRRYIVEKQGTVVAASGTRNLAAAKSGIPVVGCPEGTAGCEWEIDGQQHLLVRSAIPAIGEGSSVYVTDIADVTANPILGVTRLLMAAGALLGICGALAIAAATGRSMAKPLRVITASCAQAQDLGQLPSLVVPVSGIAEVDALATTLVGAVRNVEASQGKLTQAYFQFMGAIVAMLDARDNYTAGHSHRVSAYSEALARDFGLPQDQIDDIRVGALLHDIGKIGVPDEVLRKHERLTAEEFALMKQHPTIGRKILEQVVQFEKYLDAIEFHHENLDGSGYPRGLRGEQIPIAARIVKVADVYDALSTDRPYRKGMPPQQVHSILREGSGTHFDRLLVEIFLTRCVPSFEARNGLAQLHRAVGGNRAVLAEQKTAGV